MGDTIKRLRLKAGMTQADLAKLVGVKRQTIYKYEKGIITNAPVDMIKRFAAVFHVEPVEITGWSSVSVAPERIHQLRAEHRMEQEQVAKIIGVEKETVCAWEDGTKFPEYEDLRLLANLFDTTWEYLIGISDQKRERSHEFDTQQSEKRLKFALWGDAAEGIPDEKLQEVKNFANYIKEQYKKS